MNDDNIQSLIQALEVSPDNLPLRMLLVQNLFEDGQVQLAADYLNGLAVDQLGEAAYQQLAANISLAAGQPSRAIAFLQDDKSQSWMIKARAYLALDDLHNAKACYEKAVQRNTALENPELADKLGLRETEPETDQRPKLRVITNDDTDDTELIRILHPRAEAINFADVGGLEAVKKQIRRKIILPFQKPSLFNRFRRRVGGGILLFGPPGCGKTLLARATAGECKAQFYNVAISDILDMYIGESEAKLHAIFEQARQNTPAVVFFDEVEALAAKRQHTREATSSKLVSQFLSELDGFSQNNSGVLILAATNVPWALDPAFRRPGRFDRIVFVAPPDRAARTAILDGLVSDRPGGETINTTLLASKTGGFSGADLKNLIESAVDEAIEDSITMEQEVPLTMNHVETAIGQIRPTTIEWLTTARNYAKYANESGQYNDVLAFLNKHGK
jgi:SpoVK/Ycf46/Vps4 family AAA+-type ATPase